MSLIQILTKDEEKIFELPPTFDSFAKNHFFKLTSGISEIILEMKNDSNKILFILMFGYFKATNRFFEIQNDDENFIYIATRNNFNSFNYNEVTLRTIQRYKQLIKSHFAINEYTSDIELKLQNKAIELANNFTHRKKIFFSLVDYSKKLNIEIPSYTNLAKIIGIALNHQIRNIQLHLKSYKSDERLKVLNDFTTKDENYKNRHHLQNYKKLGHSTNKKQMNNSLYQLSLIKSKFDILQPIIKEIGLTSKVAVYYSRWLEQSKIMQLTRKDDLEKQFLLLSFVKYQYFIRNDNLIDRFIAIIQSAKSSLLRYQKDLNYEFEPMKKELIQSLEDANLSIINDMNTILDDKKLSDSDKVKSMQTLVSSKTQSLKTILEQKTKIEIAGLNRFDFIEKASQSLQGKLSGIVKLLEFDKKSSNKNLINAINYFKDFSIIKKDAPIDFLNDDEKLAIFDSDDGKMKISLYKALLFIHISDGIRSGILNLKYSYKYKSFEEYLISKEEFTNKKNELLIYHELEHLQNLNTYISPINKKLEKTFEITNTRIIKELNIHFRLTNDSFILTTPKLEKTDEQLEHTISKYFPQAEFISIIDLLNSVQTKTDFLDSFKHYS